MNYPDTNTPSPQQSEITIEKWVYGGDGLGRLEGRAVLVPLVLPGERVCIQVGRERPGMLEADLVQVLTPSPERIQPKCPYFGACGGCHFQHAGHEFQLTQKVSILREVFRRVGKMEAPEHIHVVKGPPWEYRNRSCFHITEGKIGYLEAGSHRHCPVERCPISSPRINEGLAALRAMLPDERFPRFVRSIELFTNETETQINIVKSERAHSHGVSRRFFEWCAERIPGADAATLEYRVADDFYRIGHRSFFQTNRWMLEPLIECALNGAEGETAVELYAGVGLLSVPLARRVDSVTAVEAAAGSYYDLDFNASRSALAVDAQRSSAEAFLENLPEVPDFVLADPPRAGLGKEVVHHLARLKPPRMNIVSCDPATLARDLAGLVAAGYGIEKVTLIDMFPQTYHLETVTELALR